MHKIGAEDKKFLNELHLKYGKGPIDLRQELDESPETTDTFVYLAEILCGSRYVDDRSIVAIRDMLSGIEIDPL